jgi:hypothetical protein
MKMTTYMPLDVEKAASSADSAEEAGAPVKQKSDDLRHVMPAIEAFAKKIHFIIESEDPSWSNETEWDLLGEDDKEFFRCIAERIAMEEDLCNMALRELYVKSPATT